MSDLISRKKVIDILEKEKSLRCGYDADIAIFSIEKGIIELPTAYDIDKVVEEIIEEAHNTIVDFKLDKYVYTCKAIEIVKQGGAVVETKTIRDKATEWNNHSTKKVPYEFIDFVEGKREISKDDDVCEWKPIGSNDNWTASCEPDTTHNVFGVAWFKRCPYCGRRIKVGGGDDN